MTSLSRAVPVPQPPGVRDRGDEGMPQRERRGNMAGNHGGYFFRALGSVEEKAKLTAAHATRRRMPLRGG